MTANTSKCTISILSTIFSFVFFACVVHAQTPQNAPKTKYWVTDQAKILSYSTIQNLTDDAVSFEKQTTNQVVVVTVNSLEGFSIEQYGLWLANNWGIGQSGKNNGVLLLVAPNERKVRIEVGKGLENILTNSIARSIIKNEILPEFKKRKMRKGIVKGHKAIIQALGGEYKDKGWLKTIWQIILLPFFVMARLAGFGGGRFSGGGGSFGGGGASGSW